MKVRILVEVVEDGRTVARKMRQSTVPPKTVKLYEAMNDENVHSFIAEDVISGALKVFHGAQASAGHEAVMNQKPATDSQGKPTGRTVMEESLGLDIIDHMLKKDGAGVQQAPLVLGGRAAPPSPPGK